MSFFTKVASGGLLAAGVTYYYHIDIRETSQQIGKDLHRLSEQLLASNSTETNRSTFPQPVPSRVGLIESIKARWNEKVEAGVIALRETEWSSVISNTWNHTKYGAATLKDKISPVAPEVEEVTDRRQV
ncbi:BZ3500_MvSof-1268-A1-R1_Chr4-2g07193 [Microbotryum saponariae]|uniref:MICOS complex subunit MIC12 n=1 Tax=Microbotryum saponariae TaxID=289078 RepID=A0A2X0KZI3_9BASI|nr:BZ3500_MvSof-1268-A1-R1_Chr4-2g07193 [Microbotryum saponariae]SDA06858.1 BZ3501_MvSof-1269-A2-R1_Chr4-2g06904 [Microbotryum saponariae]